MLKFHLSLFSFNRGNQEHEQERPDFGEYVDNGCERVMTEVSREMVCTLTPLYGCPGVVNMCTLQVLSCSMRRE